MALVTTDAVPFLGASLLIARRDIAPASGSRSGSDDDFVDPNFFDDDYSVAATTGVCRVWEGAAVLVRHLGECEALRARLRGRRVLELGAGVGLCGLAAAAAGAHVLLTDLPAVVDEVLWENVRRNRREDDDRDDDRDGDGEDERRGEAPAAATSRAPTTTASPPSSSSSSTWSGATVPIVGPGRGTAASQALDWTKPVAIQLESQSRIARDALSRADAERAAGDDAAAEAFWRRRADPPRDPRRAAILLAAECVWLRELVEPFAETCAALMRPRGDAEACVLAFRDRSSAHRVVPGSSGSGRGSDVSSGGVVQHSGGGAFVPAAAVLEAFAARGCGCATTATFPSEEDEGFFVHIFEITPPAE